MQNLCEDEGPRRFFSSIGMSLMQEEVLTSPFPEELCSLLWI